MSTRTLARVIPSVATSDGAGVKLRRSLGTSQSLRLDPFLMLDEFGTDRPEDYIAGFPPHPHRGFETVTYMLDGHMRLEDHLGYVGELKSGGVQWMTAGRGIVHSEMPQQEQGRMRGFQLWINLPAKEKMKPASYRDIPAQEIPVVTLAHGGRVKVIAGRFEQQGETIAGAITGLSTEPVFFDVELPAGGRFGHDLPEDHNALLYPYEGELRVAPEDEPRALERQHAGILSRGARVEVAAGEEGARFILLAGKPINEPVAQYGPFVMNTTQEIEQALRDYRDGTLTGA